MKIVLVTGGFDPIHSGHISYLKSAKALGDKLVVGLNSDAWLDKKKEKFFMPFTERKIIIENLSCVDLFQKCSLPCRRRKWHANWLLLRALT